MKTNIITKTLGIVAGTSLMFVAGVLPALATTSVGVSINANVNVSTKISAAIARGDKEIDRRITALNALSTRIGEMVKLSASEKTSFQASITAQVNTLTTLKAKIDADTDATVLKTDVKSITDSYRIFALILPQGRLMAAADRASTIASSLTTISGKLQVRISDAQTAGNNVSAMQTSLADMNAKIADANTQATAATNAVISLQPDNGNATVAASNKAALQASRADIKTATSDLTTARNDAQSIIKALEALKVDGEATTTVR
jgi:hypothetical protein